MDCSLAFPTVRPSTPHKTDEEERASGVQIWNQPHTKLSNDMFTATRQDKEFPDK